MLAKCLDVNVVWLWTGKGNADGPEGELTSEEGRLLAMFRLLPVDRQSILLQMATTMGDGEPGPNTPIEPHTLRSKRN